MLRTRGMHKARGAPVSRLHAYYVSMVAGGLYITVAYSGGGTGCPGPPFKNVNVERKRKQKRYVLIDRVAYARNP